VNAYICQTLLFLIGRVFKSNCWNWMFIMLFIFLLLSNGKKQI